MKIPGNSLNSVISKAPQEKDLSAKGAARESVKNDVAKPPSQAARLDKSSLVSQLKLPQDSLSRSIITFARLFSLPLETKLLSAIRQEALRAVPGGAAAQTPNPTAAVFGAAALGAAAAASKGISLAEKALAEYAAAIEGRPESFTREMRLAEKTYEKAHSGAPEDNAENEQYAQNNGGSAQEGGNDGGGFQDGRGRGGYDDSAGNAGKPQAGLSAAELQNRVTEILQERPMLDLINRIPCKNGRWIVIPFSFCDSGFEFTVSLRIFLNEGSSKTGGILILGRLDADIKVIRLENSPGQEQKRWLISLKKTEDDSSAECTVFSGSKPWQFSTAEKKRARQELAAALGLPLNRVSIKEGDCFYAESEEITFQSVDEKA